jgi:hypothetical protein
MKTEVYLPVVELLRVTRKNLKCLGLSSLKELQIAIAKEIKKRDPNEDNSKYWEAPDYE